MDAVTVIITTYDPGDQSRTKLAIKTIEGLRANLRYPDLRYIIADDGSNQETHIAPLRDALEGAQYEISIVDRKGVGVSKNTALRKTFEVSPYVFMLEDDWYLRETLPLEKYVELMQQRPDLGIVRFGYLGGGMEAEYAGDSLLAYWKLKRGSGVYIYSGQVSLRSKKFYDVVGMHAEGLSPGEEELEFCKRFNGTEGAPDIIWPAALPTMLNSGAFINTGMNVSLNAEVPTT